VESLAMMTDAFRIPSAFALVVAAACASRPNSSPEPLMTPAAGTTSPDEAPVPEAPASAPASPAPSSLAAPSPALGDQDDPTTPLPSSSDSDTPGVTSGDVAVRGQLHPSRVHAAMRSVYPAIRECHRKALELGTVEDKPVRVQLGFEITEKGLIAKLTDDTANLNPLFSSCVLLAVSRVTFQPPKGGVVSVTYPLQLTKP
jgi:hypothetical protein